MPYLRMTCMLNIAIFHGTLSNQFFQVAGDLCADPSGGKEMPGAGFLFQDGLSPCSSLG